MNRVQSILKISSKMLNFLLAKTMTKEIQIKTRIHSMLVHQHSFFWQLSTETMWGGSGKCAQFATPHEN